MIWHDAIDDDDLRRLIASGHIRYGSDRHLRIYGRLDWASEHWMTRRARVLLGSEEEAWRAGFRPCGHCLRDGYLRWKGRMAAQASGHHR